MTKAGPVKNPLARYFIQTFVASRKQRGRFNLALIAKQAGLSDRTLRKFAETPGHVLSAASVLAVLRAVEELAGKRFIEAEVFGPEWISATKEDGYDVRPCGAAASPGQQPDERPEERHDGDSVTPGADFVGSEGKFIHAANDIDELIEQLRHVPPGRLHDVSRLAAMALVKIDEARHVSKSEFQRQAVDRFHDAVVLIEDAYKAAADAGNENEPANHEPAAAPPLKTTSLAALSQYFADLVKAQPENAAPPVRRPRGAGEKAIDVRLPEFVHDKEIYALHLEDDSMEPRYRAGELIFVNPHKPPRIGDYVALTVNQGKGEVLYVKRLVARNGDACTVEQLKPRGETRFLAKEIVSMHLVMTNNDLFHL